jgi:hypothetical protein
MSGAVPPLPQYAFIASCLVKHRDNFTFNLNNGPMLVKWMALESVTGHVLSIQSDKWSYGIVLHCPDPVSR